MNKKDEGNTDDSKRTPRKVAKKANVSSVTQQDMDSSQEATDNQAVMKSGLDMASWIDMMTNMLLDLNNKVNGQGKELAVPLETSQPCQAKARPETSKARHQNTSFWIWIWISPSSKGSNRICSRYHSWRLPHDRRTAPVRVVIIYW